MLTNAQNYCLETTYSAISLPDSVLIIPNSIAIQSQSGETVSHQLSDGFLKIDKGNSSDTLYVCYNYIQRNQQIVSTAVPEYFFDSTARFREEIYTENITPKTTQEMLGLGGIEISGAFMRSVSAGAQQSAMMHSVMDLTISGDISDELRLQARMTDQQMPFEPEGNTQRLQDFDRVNVQLLHKNWGLEAGDLNIRSSDQLNFLKYNRQVQGLGVSSSRLSFDSTDANTQIVSSFARSKTGVQNIAPMEGVLGPYRVEGPQNEPFIFIIAGSEKVFLDGNQLQRGLENDYVIDYNAAEITFNANIYISKYSVIQIEFEYSDRQYNRNVTSLIHEQSIGKLDLNIGYFQQTDKPDSQIKDLSQADLDELSSLIGNSKYAEIPATDSLGFTLNKTRYAKVDTMVNAKVFQIFEFSHDPKIAHYQLSFTMVGEHNGNYRIANYASNDVVYEWVAPIDEIPQGNYEPIKRMALPQNQRVLNIGLNYQLNDESNISIEYAGSEFVSNRFNKDNSRLNGNAVSLGFQSSPKPIHFLEDTKINYFIKYEYLDSSFAPVQPFRALDFNRDWGEEESANLQAGEEHLIRLGTSISNKNQTLAYDLALRQKENSGNGFQHNVNFESSGDFRIRINAFLMEGENGDFNTDWKKALVDFKYAKFKIMPGYRFRTQRHQIHRNDQLSGSFQFFDSHQFYINREDSSKWKFSLSHEFRADKRPYEGIMTASEDAQNTQLKSTFFLGQAHKLSTNFLRRSIQQRSDSAQSEQYLQGGLNWQSSFWNDNIIQNLSFQTGTGRVLQRSYFFMEVAIGIGTHSWSDLNENGEQELNEFFEDETDYGDRNYVKVLTMGNDYQTAFINDLQYQLRWKMPVGWSKSNNLLQYLGKLSGSFNANLDTKNTFEDWKDRISPFNIRENENILSSRNLWKSNFFYNRGGKAFLESGWSESNRKQLLLDGFEGMDRSSFHFSGTFNAFNDWNLSTLYKSMQNKSFSDRVEERDYQFSSEAVIPSIMWQGNNNLRVRVSYKNENKWSPDEAIGGEVLVNSLEISNKLIQSDKGILESKISYVSVVSKLEDNQSPLAYEMFEGLRAGRNYVWNVSLRRKIIGDLNLIIQYIGRKSEEQKTIHNGSVQLTALF
ncbi:hypothetical protein SAMN05661096_03560 [Marivirga sericea]|uniref:Uncharacterized protein n=2 Tax=Marivirga sericea TaxID=1028 RepID=A0A1X7L6L2_9BACT|nr:hypothetical protein SAMN05661096_03560 [Marivirga sericea]